MIPASRAEVNAMTTNGPRIKPSIPNSFKPRNIAIRVARGDRPICLPITFGSTILRIAKRIIASMDNLIPIAVFPARNINNAHGPRMMIDPIIGMMSMTQMTSDIIIATSGAIINKPINEAANMIKLTSTCAFQKPKITLVKRAFIKVTFSAV